MNLLYLLLLVVIAVLLQRYSVAHCLDGLKYELEPDKQLVECDEVFSLQTTVTNTKRKPVLFLRLSESVPRKITVDLTGTGVQRKEYLDYTTSENDEIYQTVYLMPRQRLRRSLPASLPARGRYFFRSATLTAGDLLGLKERSEKVSFTKEVVVLPKPADISDMAGAFGNYMGNLSVRRFILSDPILTVGFRDYTGREPQRDISWTATLRRGDLMVKQYDFTAELTVTVMLNIAGGSEEEIERCYSLTRSVCERFEAQHISFSLLTNAPCADSVGHWNYISDGLGARHLSVILEGLGRATYQATNSLETLLQQAEKEQTTTRGYVLVTPALSQEQTSQLMHFEARCAQRVLLVPAYAQEEEAAG